MDPLAHLRLLKAPIALLLAITGSPNRGAALLVTHPLPTLRLRSAPRAGTGALTFGAASPSPRSLLPLLVTHLLILILGAQVSMVATMTDTMTTMEDPVTTMGALEETTEALETDTTGAQPNPAPPSAPLAWTLARSQGSVVTTNVWTPLLSLNLAVAARLWIEVRTVPLSRVHGMLGASKVAVSVCRSRFIFDCYEKSDVLPVL